MTLMKTQAAETPAIRSDQNFNTEPGNGSSQARSASISPAEFITESPDRTEPASAPIDEMINAGNESSLEQTPSQPEPDLPLEAEPNARQPNLYQPILEQFRVEGIVMSDRGSMAVINGQLVGPGHSIEDATVLRINRSGVTLHIRKRTYFIPLRSAASKSSRSTDK